MISRATAVWMAALFENLIEAQQSRRIQLFGTPETEIRMQLCSESILHFEIAGTLRVCIVPRSAGGVRHLGPGARAILAALNPLRYL